MRLLARLLVVAILSGLAACANPIVRVGVPAGLASEAQVTGMSGVRIWGDGGEQAAKAFIKTELATFRAKYTARAKGGAEPVSHILALSGGADDGAYGAGLLVGWSQRGTRPSFDLVTGISAGALIAPFAFLGRDYDRHLTEVFTLRNGEEIFRANILAGVLGGPSVADNEPLERLINSYVDQRMLARIAEERRRGRYLIVGTTNIDAQRPVFWDMGRIAQRGDKAALTLFRKVLLASAALPGIFPPVQIDVQANGQRFTEMHVDGGPTRQVFVTPGDFHFSDLDQATGVTVKRHLWVIRNAKILPEYEVVKPTALALGERSLETLTKNQGLGDLKRIYDKAVADNLDFNLAAVPLDFEAPRPAPFNRDYMQALFARGVDAGRSGNPWMKTLPPAPHGNLR
ncbi:MAG: patatin-like phospholipase family protein [Hyphomicrobiaceae bacterium]